VRQPIETLKYKGRRSIKYHTTQGKRKMRKEYSRPGHIMAPFPQSHLQLFSLALYNICLQSAHYTQALRPRSRCRAVLYFCFSPPLPSSPSPSLFLSSQLHRVKAKPATRSSAWTCTQSATPAAAPICSATHSASNGTKIVLM
jgi:hypothetical protein